MRWIYRLLDWLCDLLGVGLSFDGDLMAPDGSEAWWPAPTSEQEIRARALATYLLDDGGAGWQSQDIYAFLQADGWTWNGRHWQEQADALV